MPSSFRIGRIAGIDIGIHYTWAFAFVLIAWSLADGFFPSTFTGYSTTTYWLLGITGAIGLFASVLFHELSHSLVARARGMSVSSITLFIFGGVSNLKGEPKSARDEFLVAIVGPLSSFVLGALFWPLGQNLTPENNPVGALFTYLGFVNLMLGAFNLVPGFPLDGGRVLRSIIWAVTGKMDRATQIASYAGQAIGFLLVFWGVSRILGGDFLGGLWTAFIGWFLNSAAESTRQAQTVEGTLRGVRVNQVMDRRLPIPESAWSSTPVANIMTRAPLRTVSPRAEVSDALQVLTENEINQVPVTDDGAIVGMLSRADILRVLHLRNEMRVGLHSTASTSKAAA